MKWGEENERQMANNVMRGIRVCDGYLVCLDLGVDLPGNGARNRPVVGRPNLDLTLRKPPRQWCQKSFLLPLEHCVGFSLEEERVMQQSSVSISLSFENQGINQEQSRTCNQRDKGVVNPFTVTCKNEIR